MIGFFDVLNSFILLVIVTMILRSIKQEPLYSFFLPGLMLKFLAGVLFGLLYISFYQSGDTILYHEDATHMARAAVDEPTQFIQVLLLNDRSTDLWAELQLTDQPRALVMAKIVSLFHVITNSNYWFSGFYLSLFCFYGLWFLANRITKYFEASKWPSVIAFIIFPSVLFWSSGISKETVSLGLIAFIVGIYIPLLAKGDKVNKRSVILSLVLFLLLWAIKYYQAAILFAVLCPTLLVCYIKGFSLGVSWSFNKQILYWLSFLVWFGILATFLHPNLRLDRIMSVVVENNQIFEQISTDDTLIEFDDLQATWTGVWTNLPMALYSGLFRPLPMDVKGFPGVVAGVEGAIVLVLALISLFNARRINHSNSGILVVAIVLYVFISAILLSMSTPNFGTLVRYKTSFMPFLVLITLSDFPLLRLTKKS